MLTQVFVDEFSAILLPRSMRLRVVWRWHALGPGCLCERSGIELAHGIFNVFGIEKR